MKIDTDFFIGNRKVLSAQLPGVIVLAGHSSMQRKGDLAYKFEQESNFWYLTGINDPDWWVIITPSKTWLVSPQVSHVREVFDGSLSSEEAAKQSGIQTIITAEDADTLLRDLARKHSLVYSLGKDPYAGHYDFQLNGAPQAMWSRLERIFTKVQDCRKDIAKHRAIKQPVEVAALKKAVKTTIEGFDMVRSQLSSFKYEYEVEAAFSHYFLHNGTSGHAYDPIIAGGASACTLHYVHNNALLRKNHLVLMDVGAAHGGYAADITRTYAFGTVSARRQSIHEAVVNAQAEIISLLRPDLSLAQYHDDVDRIMKQALVDLKLIKHHDDEAYRTYFPHAVSHGLGIDVHDSLGGFASLRPGMVLTVEPGIYIPEEGTGVRIEDDVLITEKGHTNLSLNLSTSL